MRSKSQKGLLNFATAVIYKLVVIVVGLVLPRLFITSYGSELNGLRDSVKQIFTYIALLESGIGASTLQMLYKPVAEEDHDTANSYLSAAASYYNKIGIGYFFALAILGALYALTISVESATKWEVFIYFLVSGTMTGINFFYLAKIKLLISAQGDQYIVSVITMVTFVVSSVAKIILIYRGVHIIMVEAVFLAVNLGATATYYAVARRKYPWISFRAKPDFTCVRQRNSVMLHRISAVIFQNVDIVLLTFFCSLEAVSIYGMYKMVVNMVTSVVSEIGNSVNFMLGQSFNTENQDKKQYCAMIDVFNVYYSAVSFALYTVTYVLFVPFLRLYTAGMDINYVYTVFPSLFIVMELLMVGREAMTRTIEVAGHFQKTQWRTVTEAVINLSASVAFIILGKKYYGDIGGICGVLAGTIAALAYRTTDINLYANRHILKRGAWRTFAVMATNGVLLCVTAFVFRFLTLTIHGYGQFVIYGALITVSLLAVFLAAQSAINPREFKVMCSYVSAKFRR